MRAITFAWKSIKTFKLGWQIWQFWKAVLEGSFGRQFWKAALEGSFGRQFWKAFGLEKIDLAVSGKHWHFGIILALFA